MGCARNLVVRKVFTHRLPELLEGGYLATRPTPSKPSDLGEQRLIGYVEDLIAAPAFNYADDFMRGWQSSVELTGAIGQTAAVRSGAGIGVLHDYLAGDSELVRVLPELRVIRSYWLTIHENLRDVARVRAAADWLTDAVRHADQSFL